MKHSPEVKDTPAPKPAAAVPTKPTAPAVPAVNPQAEYSRAMQLAASLEKQGRFNDAIPAYRTALKWLPNDARAAAGMHKAEYHGHISEGQKLLTARKFPEAAHEFQSALKLEPNSAEAKNHLQKAKVGTP
jgi:Flp pilus assembly protein TadD